MSSIAFRLPVRRILIVLTTALSLAACAGDDTPKEAPEAPPEKLYSDALDQLDRDNWAQCAQAFDEVERQHPYSVWARRAILMSAYCYYQANKYTEAITAA